MVWVQYQQYVNQESHINVYTWVNLDTKYCE